MLSIKETSLFGVRIDLISSKQFVCVCKDIFRKNIKKNTIITPNVDFIYNAQQSSDFKSILNKSVINLCDSEVLKKLLRLKKIEVEKITGIDLVRLMNSAKKDPINCFLLGSTEDILKKTKKHFLQNYNKLNVIGFNNGYFDEEESMKIVKKINELNIQILFVGMGSPKQEMWVNKYIDFLDVNFIACIGGAFDIFSGKRKRAPKFLQKLCLE